MDSRQETAEHIGKVQSNLFRIARELIERGLRHDSSKLDSFEKKYFDSAPALDDMTYGGDEYKRGLEKLQNALDHHYSCNRHHPEHHDNGVEDMHLVDVVEMVCDWKAASERHEDGSPAKSVEINRERFDLDEQLVKIFKNTMEHLGGE